MLINGEKYACEACVRGHRVSSCTHSDRKLLHVNKKGRPVSQCQHCRSLRKARSQHVKCDCQDKAHAKEDCPHLKVDLTGTNATEPNTCCCGHGARCTCSLKKDISLGTVPEEYPQVIQPKEPHKPRISSLNSHESKATIFVNGHHKPVHKINDAHNHCGAPYRKPSRSNTVNGHREFAQRSTDSLPLLKQAPRPTESPLHTVTNATQQVRKVKSEHNSPEFGPINPAISAFQELYIPPLSPSAYSYSPFESQSPAMPATGPYDLTLPETIPDSWFMTYDEAHKNDYMPCVGVSESPSADWSQYGFCANANDAYQAPTSAYMPNQVTSYANPFEHINLSSYPRVNSSSGDVSEADDHGTVSRPSNLRTVSNASNDISSPGDDVSDHHRLSTTSSSYHGTPQANMLAGNFGNLDIDEYVAQTVAEQRRINMQRQQSSHHTPPAQQAQTPPIQPARYTPPISRGSHTPPVLQSTQSSGLSQDQQNHQLSQIQAQQSPLTPQNNSSMSYSTSQSPFGPEHPFTIHEAQAFAHMTGNQMMNSEKSFSNSPMPATLTEDPMWSAPMGTFRLDDPREDEDWVR